MSHNLCNNQTMNEHHKHRGRFCKTAQDVEWQSRRPDSPLNIAFKRYSLFYVSRAYTV